MAKQPILYFFLYSIFVLLNFCIIKIFIKSSDFRADLVYLYTFVGWQIYNCLGFLHVALLDPIYPRKNTDLVYWVFIISSILLFIPIQIARNYRGNYRGFKQLKIFNLSDKVVTIVVLCSLGFQIYKIQIAGGLLSYMFSRYGEKTDSSFATIINLFGGLTSIASGLLLPFICLKTNIKVKILVIFNFFVNLFMGVIGGASLTLLSPMISLYIFSFFSYNSKKVRRRLKKLFTGLIGLSAFGGILIRINRFDNENFRIGNITDSINEIMLSPTFDNSYNLITILTKLDPIYEFNQTILPFVHMLPRSVFPWKPIELGRIIGVKFAGTTEESFAGFVTSPMGDFYYDFGYLGIFLGMLLIGFFIGYISERLNMLKHTPFTLAVKIVFAGMSSILYSWYTGVFSSYVKFAIVIFFVCKLNSWFRISHKVIQR